MLIIFWLYFNCVLIGLLWQPKGLCPLCDEGDTSRWVKRITDTFGCTIFEILHYSACGLPHGILRNYSDLLFCLIRTFHILPLLAQCLFLSFHICCRLLLLLLLQFLSGEHQAVLSQKSFSVNLLCSVNERVIEFCFLFQVCIFSMCLSLINLLYTHSLSLFLSGTLLNSYPPRCSTAATSPWHAW